MLIRPKLWTIGLVSLLAVLAVACGEAAQQPTTVPAEQAAVVQATNTPPPQSTPTPAPTATPLPSGVVSAKDDIVLVLPEEPIQLSSHDSIGASLNAAVIRANVQDALTWQSGDDLRIVPTSATVGWEQLDPDTWRFELRQGVKFHNGEEWNAQAALPNLNAVGSPRPRAAASTTPTPTPPPWWTISPSTSIASNLAPSSPALPSL